MKLTYKELTKRTGLLKSATGLTQKEFDYLAPIFSEKWNSYIENYTFEGKPRQRKRKVFMPNRTNIRKTEEFRKIEKDLIDLLRSDESLRRINHIREEDSIVHNTRDQDYANKIIQKIAKIVPEIANLLNIGNNFKLGINKNLKNRQERPQYKKDGTTMREDIFEGERFPSFFEIFKWNPSKGIFKKELPQNSYVWVKFLTDVRDDYFNEIRGAERGFLNAIILKC